MLFKDSITGKNLLKYYVTTETNALYRQGIKELELRGFTILAIVCDGRRGLLQSFGNIPVQMCQFHQHAIIRRYLTRNPRMPVSRELTEVVRLLTCSDKESFQGALQAWHTKFK